MEENYAGVVADNTSANTNALKMITRRYPKLIACGCIGHISDLMIEDLFEVPAFKDVFKKVKLVATFVRSHRRVKLHYRDMCLVPKPGTTKKGNMLKLFSQTRFSYGDLMIQQYLANKYFLERTFVGATRYNAITSKISSSQVSMFKDIVVPGIGANRHLDVKAELIHRLTRLVCKLIHHVEQKKCKASWVNALFFALMKDFEE